MTKKKILIFGKNGQVGSNLVNLLEQNPEFEFHAFSSFAVDFSDLKNLEHFLNNLKEIPDFIINAAAYTNVDKAEEEKEIAEKINHLAVTILAKYCQEKNIKLIHYSTDYVFDGSSDQPFKEDNTKNLYPLNFYGKTKLASEHSIINSSCDYVIFRISWIYDQNGKNFVNTIKRLAMEKEEISVVDDQIGAPTSAKFVAENTIKFIKKSLEMKIFPKGIYHLTESAYMSWYDFAVKIIAKMKAEKIDVKTKKINRIKTSEYKTKATRPLNSRLDNSKFRNFISG